MLGLLFFQAKSIFPLKQGFSDFGEVSADQKAGTYPSISLTHRILFWCTMLKGPRFPWALLSKDTVLSLSLGRGWEMAERVQSIQNTSTHY